MRPAKGPPASNVAKQKETVSKKVYFILSCLASHKSFVDIFDKRLLSRGSLLRKIKV